MTTAFRERYPGPWAIEEVGGECVRVVAPGGTILATIYFEDLRTRRSIARLVTRVEAYALAQAIAVLAIGAH